MPTATKVLNVARSQIGYRAGRSNYSKFNRWYGMPGSWCDMWISWVGVNAGARNIIGRAAWTPAHAAWFRSQGRWGRTPRRGAIVFFDWPYDNVHRIQHVGIVESVRSDGRIVTIEGNTSSGVRGSQSNGGGVFRRVRSQSLVVGYGYPKYSSERDVRAMPKQRASRGSRPPLIVDGVWGRNTTRALQRYVGVTDDGEIGPATRKALQRKLGLKADGSWARVTRRTLQRALHVKDDGQWGPITIRALQRKLNGDWRR
jgi:peptidoglycan hydrolase-like protein with peptidoglycan-binding domain